MLTEANTLIPDYLRVDDGSVSARLHNSENNDMVIAVKRRIGAMSHNVTV